MTATLVLAMAAVAAQPDPPYVVVLGIAQDGGAPQAGCEKPCCAARWAVASTRRRVACLGVVEPATSQAWMIDATPDFREQLHLLGSPAGDGPRLAGILLTHAHMGHYTGLLHLGREAMGARGVHVHAMPRMAAFLRSNGPWDQLVRLGNIEIRPLAAGERVALGDRVTVTPIPVPHREEYSETVGFLIRGPSRSALYVPDVDKWERWDRRLEDEIRGVDVAWLDGTFYAGDEVPGRDLAAIPHPFITESMRRLETLPPAERAKVRFIHLNHTNPALDPDGAARRAIEAGGFRVAEELERVEL